MIRKKLILPLAIVLACSFSFQSCIGSFALTNKVLTWNRNVSNKFVNELVFFAFWILPVYEVTAAADLLVINSIEFWSGNTPLEANNKVIDTEDGQYLIHADNNGYQITSPQGRNIEFVFDKESQLWSFVNEKGEKIDFLKYSSPDHVEILGNDGNFVDVELTEEGVADFMARCSVPLMAMN